MLRTFGPLAKGGCGSECFVGSLEVECDSTSAHCLVKVTIDKCGCHLSLEEDQLSWVRGLLILSGTSGQKKSCLQRVPDAHSSR